MDLEVKDVAELLNVSETTVRHWITEGKLPSYRLNRQYRFSRVEIEDWVMRHHLEQFQVKDGGKAPEELPDVKGRKGSQQFSLYRAIHHGGVYNDVKGDTKEELITNVTAALAKRFGWDAEVVTELLLEREQMMSTSLGSGIGIPHTRDYILRGTNDIVAVVYPKKPIEYGALDGSPVHTLFFLFASKDKNHLHLLAKIAHLSSKKEAADALARKPSKEELLSVIKSIEENLL